jgi:hypothetical protein
MARKGKVRIVFLSFLSVEERDSSLYDMLEEEIF